MVQADPMVRALQNVDVAAAGIADPVQKRQVCTIRNVENAELAESAHSVQSADSTDSANSAKRVHWWHGSCWTSAQPQMRTQH